MLSWRRIVDGSRRAMKLALLALFCAGLAAPILGQEHRTYAEELALAQENAKLHLGPLRLHPRFQIRDFGYDDNVYFTREGAPVGDYSADVSFDILGYIPVGRSLILSVTESPEFRLYAKQRNLRTFTNSVSASAKLRLLNRFVLSGLYRYSDHLRRVYSEFTRQTRDINEGYQGSVFFETVRGSSVGFVGTVDDYRYRDVGGTDESSLLYQTLDRRETAGAVELNLAAFSRSLAFARAGYADYEFSNPSSQWRNSHATYVSAGLRFPLLGRARGALVFGFKRFTPRDSSQKGFEGLTADTDIDLRTGRLRWHLRLRRDNRFSYWESALYYVDDLATAGVSFYLTRSLRLDYEFASGRLDYPEPFAIALPDTGPVLIDRLDRTRLHSFGLSVRLVRTIGLSLSYNILDWRSTVPGYNLDRSFLGLNLTYDF